jgi:hypothetical protein
MADTSAMGAIMQMNELIRISEHSATGRYIGGGRDKSGPTTVRISSFICIIGPYDSLPTNNSFVPSRIPILDRSGGVHHKKGHHTSGQARQSGRSTHRLPGCLPLHYLERAFTRLCEPLFSPSDPHHNQYHDTQEEPDTYGWKSIYEWGRRKGVE